MKYFTHEWRLLDDDDRDAVVAEYRRALSSLPGPAGEQARRFSAEAALHDGYVNRIALVRAPAALTLELVVGEDERGYEIVTLRYGDVRITPGLVAAARRIAESRLTRVAYDEFDGGDAAGRLTHRLSFFPERFGELEIAFADLAFSRRRAPHRGWSYFGEPFEDRVMDDGD